MAGKEYKDCTDSPAVMITNEPQEYSFSMWAPETVEPRGRSSPDELDDAKERQKMEACNNNGKAAGSRMIENAQKKMLEKYQEQRTCTTQENCGRARPNVDEEVCDKTKLKIGRIDAGTFDKACDLLNIDHALGKDWRGLGGKLGYTVTDIQIFGTKKKTESMLIDWDCKDNHYLVHVVKILREMGRDDVADLLQKELNKEGAQCNCPECGHIV